MRRAKPPVAGGGSDLPGPVRCCLAGPARGVRALADRLEAAPRFSTDGTWDKVLTGLQVEADAAGQIDCRVSVDSTIARVHQHGATAARSSVKPTSHTGGSVE